MSPPLSIDVWSDIACPWCWIGKRRLEKAVKSFAAPAGIAWHAFELDPNAPREAPPRVDYAARLTKKYSTTPEQAQGMIDHMVATGKSEGVDMRFDRIRPSNTFDAHRLLAWAGTFGRRTALKGRLFTAYLHEGRSVSDLSELTCLAGEIGLDAEAAAEILAGDAFGVEVREDEQTAQELGITGVPFFVIGRRIAVSGAQSAATLLEALHRAASGDETT